MQKIRNDPTVDLDEDSVQRLANIWRRKIDMSPGVRERLTQMSEPAVLKNEDIAGHHLSASQKLSNFNHNSLIIYKKGQQITEPPRKNLIANNVGGEKRILSIPAATATMTLRQIMNNQLPVSQKLPLFQYNQVNNADPIILTEEKPQNTLNPVSFNGNPKPQSVTTNICETVYKPEDEEDDLDQYQLDGNNDFYNFNNADDLSNEQEEEDDDVSMSNEEEEEETINYKDELDENEISDDDDEIDQQIKSITSKGGVLGLNGIDFDDIVGNDDNSKELLVEEEPLNSGDDISDDNQIETAEHENIIICQYDKISKVKGKWKVELKNGIATLNGIDIVFKKGIGELDW